MLVPAFDHKAFGESIISLLANEPTNKQLGKAARKVVEKSFSSSKCGEGTYRIYKEVLDG